MPSAFGKGYVACPNCDGAMAAHATTCARCAPSRALAPVGRTLRFPALTLAETRVVLWSHGLGPLGACHEQPGDTEATAWRMPGGHGLTQRHAVGGKGYWGEVIR